MQTLLVACALFTDHSLISRQIIQDARSAGLSPQDTVIAAMAQETLKTQDQLG